LDEEYFRIFLSGLALDRSQYAENLFFSKIKRSIQYRPNLGHHFKSRLNLVDAYTKGGIYLGAKTKVSVLRKDWMRYFNILDKYIKGLFFHEFKVPLPKNYKIKHVWGRKELLGNTKHINKWNLSNKEIFAYGYNFVPNTFTSIWITIFYNSIFFISYVLTENELKRFGKQRKINSCPQSTKKHGL